MRTPGRQIALEAMDNRFVQAGRRNGERRQEIRDQGPNLEDLPSLALP